jgi:glutaredoxin
VKEFLSQKHVQFDERDVSADEKALAELEKLGVFATPVTVIDGDVVVGFDRNRLEQLLAGHQAG